MDRKGVRHPEFPNNYIEHIRSHIGKADIILVSSHDVVRQALVKSGIPFSLVYPAKECKDTYMKNYRERGNESAFLVFIDANWDQFIDDIEDIDCGLINKIKLSDNQYLSTIVSDITTSF